MIRTVCLIFYFCLCNSSCIFMISNSDRIHSQRSDLLSSLQEHNTRAEVAHELREECDVLSGERIDCGYLGIPSLECQARGCCWEQSHDLAIPWCYHSSASITTTCQMDMEERLECGYYGINQKACLGIFKCCWQPTNEPGIPWCFHIRHTPLYLGECGVPPIAPRLKLSRIVSGVEAEPHSWPWMVSLQGDGKHICGGSLIRNQWVVTAAHCLDKLNDYNHQTVKLGLHKQTHVLPSVVETGLSIMIAHRRYNNQTYDNDIMLVKLNRTVEFKDTISPVCLPKQNQKFVDGLHCYVTGWGLLDWMDVYSNTARQVMVPLIGRTRCNRNKWHRRKISRNMLCAGYEEGGRDTCQGDSGGPLVCFDHMRERWILTGIVSWGNLCALESQPGVYVNTARFRKWIDKVISSHR